MLTPSKQNKTFYTSTLIGLLILLSFLILYHAWLADDAYITFRTVENAVAGHGLRWNTIERVQTYTHPLWMMGLLLFRFFLADIWTAAFALSFLCTGITIYLLVQQTGISPQLKVLSVALLASSRTFADYSSSGLENPLTHLLLALFLVVFLRLKNQSLIAKDFFWLSLIISSAAVNRLDTLALFFPIMLMLWVSQKTAYKTIAIIAGQFPLISWEIYSIIYYGFPLPNTVYAKLFTHIPQSELTGRGINYLLLTFRFDFIIYPLVVAAFILIVLNRDWKSLAVWGGIPLYLIYIGRVGGDFMAGRFFSGIFIIALVLSVHQLQQLSVNYKKPALVSLAGLVLIAWIIPLTPFYFLDHDSFGVTDEQDFYLIHTSLWNSWFAPEEIIPFVTKSEIYVAEITGRKVAHHGGVGALGYLAGEEVYVLDRNGLGDPLSARLPACKVTNWRPGHFSRMRVAGHAESILADKNLIQDPQLADFYDHLVRITQGPIWSLDRWQSMWLMNIGRLNHLVDIDRYREHEPDDNACTISPVWQIDQNLLDFEVTKIGLPD